VKLGIDLSCAQCGSNRIDIPAEAGDETPIVCGECGHRLGSLGEVKAQVEKAVLRRAAG
jgi:DNA-directed RNA polymerase subunit RPC12/RpoP